MSWDWLKRVDNNNLVDIPEFEEFIKNNFWDKGGEVDDSFDVAVNVNWKRNAEQYSTLIKTYVENTDKSLKSKKKQRAVFFYFSVAILALGTVGLGVILYALFNKEVGIVEQITILIPTATSYLASIIIFPKIIAESLFNGDDEKNMIEILKNIIEHDNNSLNNR